MLTCPVCGDPMTEEELEEYGKCSSCNNKDWDDAERMRDNGIYNNW